MAVTRADQRLKMRILHSALVMVTSVHVASAGHQSSTVPPVQTRNRVPACPSFARVIAGPSFDAAHCRYSSFADDPKRSSPLRNTCFTNGIRIEERMSPEGTGEIRTFAGGKPLPVFIAIISSLGISAFDGTTNARLLRVSFSETGGMSLDCDGQTAVMPPSEFQRCIGTTMPARHGRAQCESGTCP